MAEGVLRGAAWGRVVFPDMIMCGSSLLFFSNYVPSAQNYSTWCPCSAAGIKPGLYSLSSWLSFFSCAPLLVAGFDNLGKEILRRPRIDARRPRTFFSSSMGFATARCQGALRYPPLSSPPYLRHPSIKSDGSPLLNAGRPFPSASSLPTIFFLLTPVHAPSLRLHLAEVRAFFFLPPPIQTSSLPPESTSSPTTWSFPSLFLFFRLRLSGSVKTSFSPRRFLPATRTDSGDVASQFLLSYRV